MDNTFSDSGEINLEMPDYRKAKITTEQTADTTKTTYEWENGLIVQTILVAGKINIQTNGKIVKTDEKKYKVEY